MSGEKIPNQSEVVLSEEDIRFINQDIRDRYGDDEKIAKLTWPDKSPDGLFDLMQNNFPLNIQRACQIYDATGAVKPGKYEIGNEQIRAKQKKIIEVLVSLGQDPERFCRFTHEFVRTNFALFKKIFIEMRKKGFTVSELRG